MVVASLARVHDKTEEVALDYCLDIALAAANNLDVVALKLVLCALAYITREHNLDAHRLHVGSDA